MSDLISRKALLENLMEEIPLAENVHIFKDIIENQPIVFDKENVIEDLTDWKNDAEKWAAKFDEIGDIDNVEIKDIIARTYENAIKIIEKGGIYGNTTD